MNIQAIKIGGSRFDTFDCPVRMTTISYDRCINNMREIVSQYDRIHLAAAGATCPCDTGRKIAKHFIEEESMGKIGTCRNCGREGMSIAQEGLCGGCFGRCKGLTGEDREKALAKAKKDFTVGAMKKITSIVVDKPKSAQSEHIAGEDIEHGTLVYASKGSPTESSGALITVVFDAEDVQLYDKLAAVSKKNRRSPDQQILWMIEEYLTI